MEPVAGSLLIVYGAIAVVALIAWARLNTFIALMLVSLLLALAIGMPPAGVVKAFGRASAIRWGILPWSSRWARCSAR